MPTVAILGAGTMGAGIAQVAAASGWAARLHDPDAGRANAAVRGVGERFTRLVEKGRMSADEAAAAQARVALVGGLAELGGVQLVIEAIPEDLALKQRVLADAAAAAGPAAVVATNTSSLSVARIASAVPGPQRVVGMHFFNPVPLMPLVEIIRAAGTADATVRFATDTADAWGKTPVQAADTPGFIVNRVARGYYLEPMRMLAEGVATVEELDRSLTGLGGFRMGPFALMDLVGIDVNYTVSCSVWEQLGRPARLQPSPLQQALYDGGRLGRKTGRGWYTYSDAGAVPAVTTERASFHLDEDLSRPVRRFAAAATAVEGSLTEQYLLARTLVAIINEAALALDEQVATAADIDRAMKLGTGYPAGPLEWAERIGRHTCRGLLDALAAGTADGRFAAARWLRS